MKMNVAAYIAEFFVKKNIQHIFGYQGGAIIKILDEMIGTGKIEYIQNYHEQGASFAADAYGRINGKIGVAIGTSGPGATNMVTGIVNAHLDSIPCMFLTGADYTANVTTQNKSRQNGFQDLDIVTIVKSVTKYAVQITDPNDIRYILERAYSEATTGRPGAVLIDIPIDIQFAEIETDELRGYEDEKANPVDLSRIEDVVKLISEAKRPVILAGGGIHISQVHDKFAELVDVTKIPVVNTLNGLDAYSGSYSYAGLHGNTFANLAIQNADLLLVLGARLGQRQVGKIPEKYSTAKVVHVDIDDAELDRIMPEEISIQSDIRDFIPALTNAMKEKALPDFTAWHAKIKEWEVSYGETTHMNKDGLDPVEAIKKMSPLFADNAIIAADVGQNQMWLAQAFRVRGTQRILNSSGLGSMGYSVPAAIGARIANPDAQVLAITGDGGLNMVMQELLLVGQRKLNIKTIVMNNNALGMMREVQKRYYNEHYYGANTDEFVCVDLEKLAATFNMDYIKVESIAQIDGLKDALSGDKPYIIDMRLPYDSQLSNRYDEAPIFEKEYIND